MSETALKEKKVKEISGAKDEAANSYTRRLREGFFEKYLQGKGIDIGCGNNVVVEGARPWDKGYGDGDATYMEGVENESYDFVYASHVLEHVLDPKEAIKNWWRILKPKGYLVIAVPDEDLYEQGYWPSLFNDDHKTTWTLFKDKSWSDVSYNLVSLVQELPNNNMIYAKKCDENYDYSVDGIKDQQAAERQLEVVVRKEGICPKRKKSIAYEIACSGCNEKENFTLSRVSKDYSKVVISCKVCLKKKNLQLGQPSVIEGEKSKLFKSSSCSCGYEEGYDFKRITVLKRVVLSCPKCHLKTGFTHA
jgi:predicted SAM-dependent methyltransferase